MLLVTVILFGGQEERPSSSLFDINYVFSMQCDLEEAEKECYMKEQEQYQQTDGRARRKALKKG